MCSPPLLIHNTPLILQDHLFSFVDSKFLVSFCPQNRMCWETRGYIFTTSHCQLSARDIPELVPFSGFRRRRIYCCETQCYALWPTFISSSEYITWMCLHIHLTRCHHPTNSDSIIFIECHL